MLELNRIIHGDCLEVMNNIQDGVVDMVLADPPYGTTACKWDSIIPLDKMWSHLKRIVKPNGAIVITSSQPFTTTLISSNLKWFKYLIVWEKPQGTDPFLAEKRPLNNIEDICVFYDKQPMYNPQMNYGDPYRVVRDKTARVMEVNGQTMKKSETINHGNRYPKRVVRFNQERGYHPTQKPVAMFEYLIKTYSDKGDLVVDITGGSGTTAVACRNTHRDFIVIEKEQKYVEIAKRRILNAEPQLF